MKLYFKQRLFSWLDSYDIYNEAGGTVRERVLTLLPRFELFLRGQYMGCISKELTLFRPRYNIDCKGWHVEGDFFEWDYRIMDRSGCCVATVSKEIFRLTDTYVIDVRNGQDALCALMLVLAIDAEKCSRND